MTIARQRWLMTDDAQSHDLLDSDLEIAPATTALYSSLVLEPPTSHIRELRIWPTQQQRWEAIFCLLWEPKFTAGKWKGPQRNEIIYLFLHLVNRFPFGFSGFNCFHAVWAQAATRRLIVLRDLLFICVYILSVYDSEFVPGLVLSIGVRSDLVAFTLLAAVLYGNDQLVTAQTVDGPHPGQMIIDFWAGVLSVRGFGWAHGFFHKAIVRICKAAQWKMGHHVYWYESAVH